MAAVGATGSSVGLSTLAAAIGLCCVAPWAVALLGVSGALTLAALGVYRLYFVVAAVILFVGAVWIAYRRRGLPQAVACNRHSRWLTLLFAVNALLLLVAIFAGGIQMIVQRYVLF
ncbi:MAG: hypothetical protein ACREPU_01730 [Rhodanobacteraceae bacterium]